MSDIARHVSFMNQLSLGLLIAGIALIALSILMLFRFRLVQEMQFHKRREQLKQIKAGDIGLSSPPPPKKKTATLASKKKQAEKEGQEEKKENCSTPEDIFDEFMVDDATGGPITEDLNVETDILNPETDILRQDAEDVEKKHRAFVIKKDIRIKGVETDGKGEA